MKPGEVVYDDIVKFKELKRFMEDQLEDYNMEPGIIPMDLVLFKDAIEHGELLGRLGGRGMTNNSNLVYLLKIFLSD